MKQLSAILTCLLLCSTSYCQNTSDFFKHEGVYDLAGMAHPFDTYQYQYSSYDDSEPGFITVNISYEGNYFTKLRIHKGYGSYYFDQMQVIQDQNTASAFAALKVGAALLIELQRETNSKDYEDMQRSFQTLFGSRLENWSGIQMALFALNLAYLDRYVSNN